MLKALFRIFPVMALALIAACTTSPVMYEPATTQLKPGGADDFEQYLADARRPLH